MEKKSLIVGIKPAENSDKKKKQKRSAAEPFFHACGKVWIEVYGEVVPPPPGQEKADPIFWKDDVEKRHLKICLKYLRERAEDKNVLWTEETAIKRFRAFVTRAGDDKFISANFMLRIINNNRTKIFNNQITPKHTNGRANIQGHTGSQPIPKINAEGDFGKL